MGNKFLVLHHAFCDIKGSGRNDVHAEHGMSTQMPATPTRTRLFALLRDRMFRCFNFGNKEERDA